MTTAIRRARRWLPVVAVVLAAGAAVPPGGTWARHYAVAQAVQFAVFAVVVPALVAIGWPARSSPLRERRPSTRAGRPGQPTVRASVSVLPFVALVIAWRLPVALRALDRDPILAAAELVTLVSAGTAVWLELTSAVAARQPLPRPLRAAMAAVAMWSIWVVAYVTGMSDAAGSAVRTGALSAAADRQLAVAVLWAIPAACFVPVVYTMLMRWLADRDGPDPAIAAPGPGGHLHSTFVTSRSPRGWRG